MPTADPATVSVPDVATAPAPAPAPALDPVTDPAPLPTSPRGNGSIHATISGTPFHALEIGDASHIGDGAIRREAAHRAIIAWNELNHATEGGTPLSLPGTTGLYRNKVIENGAAHVWPMSQIQAAALNIASITDDDGAVRTLDSVMPRYIRNGAYQSSIDHGGEKLRYTDDNMAIGLNFVQAYRQTGDRSYLAKAEAVMPFLESMIHANGGLNWREGSTAYVSDSIAGGQKLALLLAQETDDPDKRERYINFARTCDTFLEARLRATEGEKAGLVLDNVESTNEMKAWADFIFSYNEGWSIGADIEWFKSTGDHSYLERARRTADATLAYYSSVPFADGIWSQPPSFNANFFENLLALEAIDPPADGSRPYEDRLRSYLDRAWTEARDPETGWFEEGGIGSFTGGIFGTEHVDTIDQAGMVQMYALLAMTPEQRINAV